MKQLVAFDLDGTLAESKQPLKDDMGEALADLALDGIPSEDAEPLAHLFTEVLDGRNASITEGVERMLQRPPSSFAAYAQRTAAAGAWA